MGSVSSFFHQLCDVPFITFESTVFKKATEFSNNIKRNISTQVEKEVNIFNLLNAISE